MSARIYCLFLAFYLAYLTNSPALYAQISPKDQPMVDKILADWQARYKTLEAIEYIIEGTGERVSKNRVLKEKLRYEILFETSTRKLKIKHISSNLIESRTQIYDGKYVQTFLPPEYKQGKDKMDRFITTVPFPLGTLDADVIPVFAAHGIIAIGEDPALRPFNLEMRSSFDTLSVLGHKMFDNKDTIILSDYTADLQPGRRQEFWIDPTDRSCLLRYQEYYGGKLSSDFQIKYQKLRDSEITLPESWVFVNYKSFIVLKNNESESGNKTMIVDIDDIKLEYAITTRKYRVESIRINPHLVKEDFFPAIHPKEKIEVNISPPPEKNYKNTASFRYEMDENLNPILYAKTPFKDQANKEIYPDEILDWIPKQKSLSTKATPKNWLNLFYFTSIILIVAFFLRYGLRKLYKSK